MRMIVLVLALVTVAVVAYACARAGLARRRRRREREASARRAALAARERARAQQQARWDRQADDLSDAVTSVMPAINLPLLRQPVDDVPRVPAFRPQPPMTPASEPPAARQELPSYFDPAAARTPADYEPPGVRPRPAADYEPPAARRRPAAESGEPPPAFPPRSPMTPDFDPPRPVRGRPAFDPPAFAPQPPMAPAFDPPPPARGPRPSIFDPASRALPPQPAEVSDFELPRQPEADSPWPPSAHPAIAHELTGSRAAHTADRGAPDRNRDRPSGHQGGRHGKHRSRG